MIYGKGKKPSEVKNERQQRLKLIAKMQRRRIIKEIAERHRRENEGD